MNEFYELEFKFSANNIKLKDFTQLMTQLIYKEKLEISSWDRYYVNNENKDEFIRFRNSNTPEFTRKRKVNQGNNWKRIEIDLPLDPNRMTTEIADRWAGLDGYTKKADIFKTCAIYWFDTVNLVYYLCYDENLTELGRFIEIESNKDNGLTEEQSFQEIKKFEQELGKLGITPHNRLKRSLFEMYVKD